MHEAAATGVDRLAALAEAERTFQMDEEAFRLFYEKTARPLRVYLARMTRDDRLADDLLQETYYRFLRSGTRLEDDDHRRHYLFRIATNLAHDHRRRLRTSEAGGDRAGGAGPSGDAGDRMAARIDLSRALARLKPRDRSVLWLAYAMGWSHQEIAAAIGVKTASMKALLHRARRRLVALLGAPRDGGRS